MPIYEYVKSHINFLRQHVSVIPVTITSVSYNKNTINTQISV